jgi:integrase
MQTLLEPLIKSVLEELKRLGMSKLTIKTHKYSAYSPIRNYCARNGTTCYEPATLNAFICLQKKRLEKSEISEKHFRMLRRAVLMLHDFYQHGTLQGCRYDSGYEISEHFDLCLKQFLEAQHLSKGTIYQLRSNILRFLYHIEHAGHRDFSAISPEDVKDYVLVAAERNKGGMPNILYALRTFSDYLRSNSIVSKDFQPVLNKPAQRKKRVLPCFTHEDVEAILKQIDTSTKQGKRDYAILFLASHTGLRSIDIANLQLSNIDWMNDSIHIVQRKTGRPLVLPLEPDTGNAIAQYILEARPESTSEYIFLRARAPYRKVADGGTLYNILKKYLKSAGILHQPGDGKSFHALRRSMGTWMLESGVPLTTISQVLGHKEQDSTKQYLSMDHVRLASCALDFQEIPVGRGIFE